MISIGNTISSRIIHKRLSQLTRVATDQSQPLRLSLFDQHIFAKRSDHEGQNLDIHSHSRGSLGSQLHNNPKLSINKRGREVVFVVKKKHHVKTLMIPITPRNANGLADWKCIYYSNRMEMHLPANRTLANKMQQRIFCLRSKHVRKGTLKIVLSKPAQAYSSMTRQPFDGEPCIDRSIKSCHVPY